MKLPTKKQILEAGRDCPDAKVVLKRLFPEAFEEEWIDVSKEIDWGFRADTSPFGVLIMKHDGVLIGHLWADGEFYMTTEEYKIEWNHRNFCVLRRNEKV